MLCSLCKVRGFEKFVLEEWIVPMFKEKGVDNECKDYRDISILGIGGQVHGKGLNESNEKVTGSKVRVE